MKETFCLIIVIYVDVINTHETTNHVYILYILYSRLNIILYLILILCNIYLFYR